MSLNAAFNTVPFAFTPSAVAAAAYAAAVADYRSAQLVTLGFNPHPNQLSLVGDRSEAAIAAAAERGLQRLIDVIVWEWDNPSDWVPLKE
jgi:hypothetical protein